MVKHKTSMAVARGASVGNDGGILLNQFKTGSQNSKSIVISDFNQ